MLPISSDLRTVLGRSDQVWFVAKVPSGCLLCLPWALYNTLKLGRLPASCEYEQQRSYKVW